jgi:hypothetical protein
MAKPSRTLLEELVTERTRVTLGIAASRTIEQVAEELALELIKSPEFKAHLRGLILRSFGESVAALHRRPKSRNGHKRR